MVQHHPYTILTFIAHVTDFPQSCLQSSIRKGRRACFSNPIILLDLCVLSVRTSSASILVSVGVPLLTLSTPPRVKGRESTKHMLGYPGSVASHPAEVQCKLGAALQMQCPQHGSRNFVKASLDWLLGLCTPTSKLHLLVTSRHLYALQSITPVSLVPSDTILNAIHTYYSIIDCTLCYTYISVTVFITGNLCIYSLHPFFLLFASALSCLTVSASWLLLTLFSLHLICPSAQSHTLSLSVSQIQSQKESLCLTCPVDQWPYAGQSFCAGPL